MNPINLLVFPCGSEIALEIHRSLKYSRFVKLYGGNSVSDHGQFIYENYIDGIPFVNDEAFIPSIKTIVEKYNIEAIYPAMDSVITKLKENEELLGCKVITSAVETTQICLSKTKTYSLLQGLIPTPKVYSNNEEIAVFPVFVKPDIGYGSRGAKKITAKEDLEIHIKSFPDAITLEYLPGEEYTIDCFTNSKGQLIFVGGRLRQRIVNGISVNTIPVLDDTFKQYAEIINKSMRFCGAWFFQLKKNMLNEYVLLEVAARMGGSSSLYRNKGVNFALLSVFDAFGYDVAITENMYDIELDRALDNKYKISYSYDVVYLDFDDCLLIDGKVNEQLVSFVFRCINSHIPIKLITKHSKDINESLLQHRLTNLFDEVIHISQSEQKYKYITSKNAIFIDDSFAERKQVADKLNIPVFSPDMVESLL